jgi:hypothetical protein
MFFIIKGFAVDETFFQQFPLCIATKTQSHEIPRKFSVDLVFLCFSGRFYQRNALKAGIADIFKGPKDVQKPCP